MYIIFILSGMGVYLFVQREEVKNEIGKFLIATILMLGRRDWLKILFRLAGSKDYNYRR